MQCLDVFIPVPGSEENPVTGELLLHRFLKGLGRRDNQYGLSTCEPSGSAPYLNTPVDNSRSFAKVLNETLHASAPQL